MNIENLEVGNRYKNYSELCEALNIEPKKNSNSKKAQMKEIERHIRYSKEGHIFVVDEIYDTPLPKTENKRNLPPYTQYMETLLLQYLQQEQSGKMSVSTSQLAKSLKMVHEDYLDYYDNKKLLATQLDVELIHINDFMNTTSNAYKNAIKTILSRLEKRAIILYETRWKTVVKEKEILDDGKVKEKTIVKFATEEQKKEIVNIRYNILNEYGGNMQEIYQSGKAQEYYIDLEHRYKLFMGLDGVYKTHEITINENAIENEYYKSLQSLVQDVEGNQALQTLSNSIWADKNLDRMKNKVTLAKKNVRLREIGELDTPPSKFESERLQVDFIDKMKVINNVLIVDGLYAN